MRTISSSALATASSVSLFITASWNSLNLIVIADSAVAALRQHKYELKNVLSSGWFFSIIVFRESKLQRTVSIFFDRLIIRFLTRIIRFIYRVINCNFAICQFYYPLIICFRYNTINNTIVFVWYRRTLVVDACTVDTKQLCSNRSRNFFSRQKVLD